MSVVANPPSWIETVFQLGVKRSALVQQLTLLKRQHNEVIPIGQLPAEILSLIFHFLIHRDWATIWNIQRSVKTRRSESELEFVATASQVCHRWREVALQDSTLWNLWSTFEFRSSSWLQEIQRRSRRSPLTFRILPNLNPPGVVVLKAHAPNIRRLEIAIGDAISTLTHLTNPHPLLESLLLSYYTPHSSISHKSRPLSSDSMLPGTAFAGKAPRLSNVSLISVLVDLRLSAFANVVNLSISKIRLEKENLVDHFTAGLKAMRHLETLVISHSILKKVPLMIPLPKLRLLSIRGRLLPFSKLLTKLRTPSTCSIHVVLSINPSHPTGADLIGEYIARTTEDYPLDATATHWAITLTSDSLEVEYRKHQLEDPHFSFILQSRDSTAPFHATTPAFLAPLLCRLPSYNLCINAKVHEKSIFRTSAIVELFLGQPTVTSVGFNGSEAFLQTVPHLVQDPGNASSLYLPSLRSVQFKNILMKNLETKRKIIRFLKLRSQCESPIQVVDIVSCAGAEPLVKSLLERFEDLNVNIRNR